MKEHDLITLKRLELLRDNKNIMFYLLLTY